MNASSVPAISVLMPVYNCEPYLDEAIRSIRDQTFTDFEFVIVNDGSTDGSLDTIHRHAAEDPRIIVLDRPNGGIVDALNAGLAVCRGEFIARMDGDDVAMPTRFEQQLSAFSANPHLGLLGTCATTIDSRGEVVSAISYHSDHQHICLDLLSGHCALLHPTIIARREVFTTLSGYTSEYQYSEDLDLYIRAAQLYELANISNELLKYRRHAGSICAKVGAVQSLAVERVLNAAKARGQKVSNRTLAKAAETVSWRWANERQYTPACLAAARAFVRQPFSLIGPKAVARILRSIILNRGLSTETLLETKC